MQRCCRRWAFVSRAADDPCGRLAAGESNIVGGAGLPTSLAVPDDHGDRAISTPGVLTKAQDRGSNTR